MVEQNYQHPTVSPLFSLYKELVAKQENSRKPMSEHTAELRHIMQSMTDLVEITPDLIAASSILRPLPSDHSQFIQQIKAMDLKDSTTRKNPSFGEQS